MDKPILAFLLGDRTRAARLLRYGSHLSDGLIQLAEELAGPLGGYSAAVRTAEESPYRDWAAADPAAFWFLGWLFTTLYFTIRTIGIERVGLSGASRCSTGT
jgi:hypothetical protein